jgi:Fic family protein
MELKATLCRLRREHISIFSEKTMSDIEHLKHRCDGYRSTKFYEGISKIMFNVLEEDAYRHSQQLENVKRKRMNNFQSIYNESMDLYEKNKTKIDESFLFKMAKLVAPEAFGNSPINTFRHTPARICGNLDFYIPPEPSLIRSILEDFIWVMNSQVFEGISGSVKRALLFHFWLVMIHPFPDGNGRTARHVQNIILLKHKIPPVLILRKERKDYLDKLEYASFYAKSRAREIWSILYEREDEFNGYAYLEKNDLLVKLYLSPTEYETGFYDYLASKIVYGFQSILSALDKERK